MSNESNSLDAAARSAFGLEPESPYLTEEYHGVTLLPEGDDLGGTHRVGEYSCSLSTLRKVLGPGLGPSGDGKTTDEWHFDTPYGVASLYDYKGFCCSIGGRNTETATALRKYLNAAINAWNESQ